MLGEPFRPMEPVPAARPFDDEAWAFQVKWDGVRILAHLAGGEVRLFNRKLHERTAQYPEVCQALLAAFQGENGILDGEVIALRDQKPAFARVLQRDRLMNPAVISARSLVIPVNYMVFDVLCLDGHNLTGMDFDARQRILADVLQPKSSVLPVDTVVGRGRDLFAGVESLGLEGIVAKRRQSRYQPGQKSREWLKIKVKRRQLCVVGGFTERGGRLSSLLLGVFSDDRLVFVGGSASGLSDEQLMQLEKHLRRLETATSPFYSAPRLSGVTSRWVVPRLVVLVEFLEWTEDLKLRHSRILGFSEACPEACRV